MQLAVILHNNHYYTRADKSKGGRWEERSRIWRSRNAWCVVLSTSIGLTILKGMLCNARWSSLVRLLQLHCYSCTNTWHSIKCIKWILKKILLSLREIFGDIPHWNCFYTARIQPIGWTDKGNGRIPKLHMSRSTGAQVPKVLFV
jgi:hypothetical protein